MACEHDGDGPACVGVRLWRTRSWSSEATAAGRTGISPEERLRIGGCSSWSSSAPEVGRGGCRASVSSCRFADEPAKPLGAASVSDGGGAQGSVSGGALHRRVTSALQGLPDADVPKHGRHQEQGKPYACGAGIPRLARFAAVRWARGGVAPFVTRRGASRPRGRRSSSWCGPAGGRKRRRAKCEVGAGPARLAAWHGDSRVSLHGTSRLISSRPCAWRILRCADERASVSQ